MAKLNIGPLGESPEEMYDKLQDLKQKTIDEQTEAYVLQQKEKESRDA